MSPSQQEETEHKFWTIPEMIAKLLPFLDLKSTLCLAQAHKKTKNLLEGGVVFKKLLKRNSPLIEVDKVKDLVAILKLMKNPKANLPEVLAAICESNLQTHFCGGSGVRMGCPHHSYSVSQPGFELLEMVEGAFGTTAQTVENVSLGNRIHQNTFVAALASRLTRQQQPLTSISLGKIEISCEEDTKDFKTLMQAISPTTTMAFDRLSVVGLRSDWTREAWAFVAEALRAHPGLLSEFFASKDVYKGGKREEIRVVWEALKPDGRLIVGIWDEFSEAIEREEGEAGWAKLGQILDRCTEEWSGAQTEADEGLGPDGVGLDGGMAAQMDADG